MSYNLLPGLPDHTLPGLNHNRTDHNTNPMGVLKHRIVARYIWIHFLLYDVITSLVNIGNDKPRCCDQNMHKVKLFHKYQYALGLIENIYVCRS